MSVVFDFNDLLNDFTPVPPMLLPVDAMRNEKSELSMDAICVSSFLLSSPPRSSFVSVVFDFNDSLNDFTPVPPMLFPVGIKRNEKEWIVDGCHLCVFFLFVFTTQIEFSECCV